MLTVAGISTLPDTLYYNVTIVAGIPHYLTLIPMYLWILIFFTQAHKEERFLYPIYPLICLSAALTLDASQVTECTIFYNGF